MSNRIGNLFYNSEYLDIQDHKEMCAFRDRRFQSFFSIRNEVATSMSRGLFGSFESEPDGTQREFLSFAKSILEELTDLGVHRIEVIHPPEFYRGFVPLVWLEEVGFSRVYEDINHHIELANFQMHAMEKRKLEKLNQAGVVVRELESKHLNEAYEFLTICRREKELELNISFEKLEILFQVFPDRYSIFGAYLRDQLVSVVITVQTIADVVYYYLPGTREKYKKESPMVGLIQYLVDHFKSNVKYLDLGVSSVKGKPQDGLISFKEKMGGIGSLKNTYKINL